MWLQALVSNAKETIRRDCDIMLVYKTTFSKYVFRSRNLPFVMWTCCNHSERRRLFQGGKKGKYFLLVNKQLKNGCTVLSIWHDFLALRRIILSLKNRGLWGSFNSTAIYVLNAKNFQKIKATSILTVLLFFSLSGNHIYDNENFQSANVNVWPSPATLSPIPAYPGDH